MSQDRYGIFPALFYYAGPTTLAVRQIDKVSVKAGAKRERPIPGGLLDPAAAILNNAEPIVDFSTKDIATMLAAISPSAGLACPTGGLIQYQKRTDGGTFAGTLSHVTLASGKGMLIPKSLHCDQDADGGAELDLEFHAHYDGTLTSNLPTPPLAIAVSQSLTNTPLFTARFYLGPIYLHSTPLAAIKGWSLDFGIEYKTMRADGDLYPQVGSIVKREPVFTFKITKVDYASTIASLFIASPGNDLNFYLRQGTNGGARLADNTSSHIKLATATSGWCADNFEVAGEDDTTVTVLVYPTAAISVATATTVP